MKLCLSPDARSSSSLIVLREAGLAYPPVKVGSSAKQMEGGSNCRQWTGIDLAQWSLLSDDVRRVAARPKVQGTLRAEGLLQ